MRYDLVVLGNDPAGITTALEAARQELLVALVQPHGDAAFHPVMIRAALEVTLSHPEFTPTFADVQRQVNDFCQQQHLLNEMELAWEGVDVLTGDARFINETTIEIHGPSGCCRIEAERIVLAGGTQFSRPTYVPFNGTSIIGLNDLHALRTQPRTVVMIGGDELGRAYAKVLARLGTLVTTVEDVLAIRLTEDGSPVVYLENGETPAAELVVYGATAVGTADELNLEAAGLLADERGQVWCDEAHQTWAPHITAVGDIIGFPARHTIPISRR